MNYLFANLLAAWLYIIFLCILATNALMSLPICADPPETSMLRLVPKSGAVPLISVSSKSLVFSYMVITVDNLAYKLPKIH